MSIRRRIWSLCMIIYCFRPIEEIRRKQDSPMRRAFAIQYRNTDPFSGKRLVEPYGDGLCRAESTGKTADRGRRWTISTRFHTCRTWHPMYDAAGGIPAIAEVKFSLVSNRGCFGGCSFCALTMHQGRIVQTRSHESILAEAVE